MLNVRDVCKYQISFIVRLKEDVKSLLSSGVRSDSIYCLSDDIPKTFPFPDASYLSSLERGDVPTIHNMIIGDRVVSKLPYSDAIAYAKSLSGKFQYLYRKVKPSVVIGCHDAIHSGIGCAVARAEKVPWFSLSFSTIPPGYVALKRGIIPDKLVCIRRPKESDLVNLAEKFLNDFEKKIIVAPTYISAHNVGITFERLPKQVAEGIRVFKKSYFGGLNKYQEFDFKFILKQFFRKKKNMVFFPKKWFLKEPPTEPYLFFGLHMQPESTIDSFAPFYSNQFSTIEIIARSLPPTHSLLVKLHISDADNYSRTQLKTLLKLPGIKLVAPNVSSRRFIEKSSAIITITGNMGLEGALLGKPVLIFGRKNYEHFPSVTRIEDITNLPFLIKQKLAEKKPNRDSIISAYSEFLMPYFRASRNDWKRKYSTQEEIDGFVVFFQALEKYLIEQSDIKSHDRGKT